MKSASKAAPDKDPIVEFNPATAFNESFPKKFPLKVWPFASKREPESRTPPARIPTALATDELDSQESAAFSQSTLPLIKSTALSVDERFEQT